MSTLPPKPKPTWTPVNRTAGFAWGEDDLEAYGRACREAALEEAAQVCIEHKPVDAVRSNYWIACSLDKCAAAIRALKAKG